MSGRYSERIRAKADRSTPSDAQARALGHRQQPFDHVALGGDEQHALAGSGGRVDDAERMEVEHRVGERHRHLVLGLEANGGRELLAVGDRRKLEHAHHRALVGDADAHARGEVA